MSGSATTRREVVALFFLSGAAALIYQVAWHRLLLSVVGVDVVSAAVVVSAFMLGLGVGALVGGAIADKARSLIGWFAALELCIGLFGVASPLILSVLSTTFLPTGLIETAMFALATLLLPTTLMGATLPILVVYVDRSITSIGESTGLLYFANTLGGALGAIATGFVLFHYLSLSQAVLIAGALNGVIALYAITLRTRSQDVALHS